MNTSKTQGGKNSRQYTRILLDIDSFFWTSNPLFHTEKCYAFTKLKGQNSMVGI